MVFLRRWRDFWSATRYHGTNRCPQAYYGGEARCELDVGGSDYDPAELVCGGCSDVARAQMCPKHGADLLEYKCRYCCSVAVFFCFGTTHFCNACHDDFQRVTNLLPGELPPCPAGNHSSNPPAPVAKRSAVNTVSETCGSEGVRQ